MDGRAPDRGPRARQPRRKRPPKRDPTEALTNEFESYIQNGDHDIPEIEDSHLDNNDAVLSTNVFLRIRPFTKRERDEDEQASLVAEDQRVIFEDCNAKANGEKLKHFTFNDVFQAETQQDNVYAKTIAPHLPAFIAGVNVTLFCYGQTGSGKTHTMFGSDNPKRPTLGIVPRVFAALFSNDLTDGNVRYTISALEIYNEQLTDLLSPRDIDGKLARVQLREHPKKGHFVHGLLRTSITSLQDSVSILRTLLLERATGETAMNQRSSRSHVVVTIQRIEATSTFKKRSKLLLIDLAGSERVKKSNSSGMQIKEGAAINLSLSCLGNVIDALIRNRPHVPFRSSKLTRLLQDSLSGNCKTVVVATVSAARTSAEETLSTLRFADRIKSIQNEVYANDVAVSEKEQTQAANKVLQETNARIQKEKEALEAKVVELESRLLAMSRELQVARRAPQASTEMPSAPSPSPPSNAGYRRDIDDGSALSDIPSGSEYSDSDEEVDTRAAAEPQAIDKTYVVAKANKSATRRGADHTRGSGRDSSAARSSQPVGSTTSKSCSIQ